MKKKNSPDFICYDVAARCIAKCDFCIADFSKDELNTADAKKVITKIAKTGVKMISLSGREPFLRKDLFILLEHAKTLKLPIIIETTGAFLTKKTFKKLKEYKTGWLSISIDSLDKQMCKNMGRYYLTENQYQTIREGCKENNIALKISTIINKITLPGINEIGNLFLDHPPDVWKLRQFIPRGLGRRVKTKYTIPDSFYVEAIKNTTKKFPSLKIKYSNINTYDNSLIIIAPNGDINKVIGENYINYGNICNGISLVDVWNKKFTNETKKQLNKENFKETYKK